MLSHDALSQYSIITGLKFTFLLELVTTINNVLATMTILFPQSKRPLNMKKGYPLMK